MDASGGFLILVIVFQLLFSGALVALVGRGRPAMLPLYRWLAPAALPLFLFAMVAIAVSRGARGVPLAQVFASYLTVWIAGVLIATLVIRIGGWQRR